MLVLCFTIFSCQKQDSSAIFEVGKNVAGTFGNNFEMFISDNRQLMNEKS